MARYLKTLDGAEGYLSEELALTHASVLAALRLPGNLLWPCACGSTARFARLLGLPVEIWAIAMAATAAV